MEITEQAIDEIVEFINKKLNIPYIPESIESILIEAVILALFHVLGEESIQSLVQKQWSI